MKYEKVITGTVKCKYCNMNIKWHYIFHSKEFGIYLSSTPTDTRCAIKVEDTDNTFYVRCLICDRINYFEYAEG